MRDDDQAAEMPRSGRAGDAPRAGEGEPAPQPPSPTPGRAARRSATPRPIEDDETVAALRRLLAEVCKLYGDHLATGEDRGREFGLPPRLRQTLKHLMRGDSEKEVAGRLGLSQHTVHVYVKQLYRRLKVNSRAELLAKFARGASWR